MLGTKPQMFRRAIQTAKFAAQAESLQYSIHDVQLPIAARCQTDVVRNDKKRLVAVAREIQQQIHNRVARFGIEISRRLISKNNVGIIGQGSRNGNALLLSA